MYSGTMMADFGDIVQCDCLALGSAVDDASYWKYYTKKFAVFCSFIEDSPQLVGTADVVSG